MFDLPKGYLSYSSWSLWVKNKDAFRKKYYLGEDGFENEETRFGKQIAELLENEEEVKKHKTLKKVKRYKDREHSIEVVIGGVLVKGYLDTFDPKTKTFAEHKTGHTDKKGKPPWDRVNVAKHEQLPFYSLLIKEKYGKVNRKCHLNWIETCFKKNTVEFDGHILLGGSKQLELTGKVKVFPRIIFERERQQIKKSIIKVAEEITNDFRNYKKTLSKDS